MTEDIKPCQHKSMHFGSGGYYVLCSEPGCNATWIAWKIGEDERVAGVQKGQPVCGSSVMGSRVEERGGASNEGKKA